uniref:Uncharacterized protein n=1 Tax=Glossina austeni TaxID=7395 RepID=A0A1A9UEA6_GLOAU
MSFLDQMLEIDCKIKLMNSTDLLSQQGTAEFVYKINLKVRSSKSAIESVSSSEHLTLPQEIYNENNGINFCTSASMIAKEHLGCLLVTNLPMNIRTISVLQFSEGRPTNKIFSQHLQYVDVSEEIKNGINRKWNVA